MNDNGLIDLVARAADGDNEARSSLVSRFTPLARSTAARLVNDPTSIDDVVQETFVELFATLARLRHPEAFPAWVRLGVRKHADRLRRSTRSHGDLTDAGGELSYTDDEAVERRELTRSVQAALARIRTDDRHLLELRYLADWTIPELADALGVGEGVVRKRLHDARRRARSTFSDHENQETRMTDYERLLGRVYAPGDLADLDDAVAVVRPHRRTPITTGLKILDSIAPIARGGTVELVGPVGTGHLVLVIELSYRLNRTDRESAIVAIACSSPRTPGTASLTRFVTDVDEHGRHAVIATDEAAADVALSEATRLAHGLASTGVDVLLAVDKATAEAVGGVSALKDLAGVSGGGGSVTLILVDAYERGLPLPEEAGLDTRLVFSLEQVALGIYPALDPIESRARFHDSEIAESVKRLLTSTARLRQYFSQPMYASADYTGVPATWVDPEESDRQLQQLIEVTRRPFGA